jgi:hypothetical protein
MIGFDRDIQICIVHDRSEYLLKNTQTLSANKTARGILSPIPVKDLGFVYALA